MKSLVTGGAGFIGSNLVDQLVKIGHKVIVLDNFSIGRKSNLSHHTKKNVKTIKIDISGNKKLDGYFKGVDYVFHLAGLVDIIPSIENPNKYFKSNVVGTLNILQAAKRSSVKKFIYAGSASCYGTPEKYPTNEKSKIDPQNPYALTKYLGEQLVIHWAKVYNMPNVSLRFFNAYGLRSSTKGTYGSVFGIFLAQKLAKKPLTIVGDGKQTRDFIHVYELVDAIIKTVRKGKNGEIYNVGSGKEISINFIANLIGGSKFNIPKRLGETDRSLADISKIKEHLNWQPQITIEEGIKKLLKNISNWEEAPVWTPKKIKNVNKTLFEHLNKK